MVQIVPSSSALGEFLGGAAPGISDALSSFFQRKRAEGQLAAENQALKALGHENLSGIRTPKFREALLESSIRGKEQKEKLTALKGNLAIMEKLGFLPEGASQIGDEALAKLLANYEIGQKEASAAEERTIRGEERGEERVIRGEERGEKRAIRSESRAEGRKIAEENRKLQRSQDQAEALGIDKRITEPSVQNALIQANARDKKSDAEFKKDIETASVMEKYFGSKAAEIYPHLTEGGKTKFIEQLLESKVRGMDLEDALQDFSEKNPQEFIQRGLQRRPDETGLTPKEIATKRQREREFKTTTQTKRSEKVLEEAYDLSKNFEIQQANIDLIKNALEDVSGFDQDYLAELFHYEPLRTAKGTQLKSAGKDLFIKTIQGTGNRPNQWIEQQIGSALTQIGKTREANETVAEIAQFQLDLNKEKVRLINELEDQYEDTLGYVPGKIGRDAEEMLKPYAAKRQEKLAYDLRRIYEREQGTKKLSQITSVPPGTPLTLEMASILLDKANGDEKQAERLARKMGFTIPSEEIYQREFQ